MTLTFGCLRLLVQLGGYLEKPLIFLYIWQVKGEYTKVGWHSNELIHVSTNNFNENSYSLSNKLASLLPTSLYIKLESTLNIKQNLFL